MTTLTPELLDLMDHEKVIEQGLATFVEVGHSLLAIKNGKKYRAAGYDSFEDYCRKRWGWTVQRGYQMISAAEIAETVSTNVESPPTSEGQIRPLTKLDSPDAQREAWSEAVHEANGQPTAADVKKAVEEVKERRTPRLVPKRRVRDDVPPHPATYPVGVLQMFRELLGPVLTVLDPFAGIGKIHNLQPTYRTVGVELEAEWARAHPDTIVGDSRELVGMFGLGRFDAIATSPAYGNRLADHYDAYDPESRRTYSIDLGRRLSDGNGAGLHYATDGRYEDLHRAVWEQCRDVLVPDGVLLLNVKDFVRNRRVMDVSGWHVRTLVDLGFTVTDVRTVSTGGLPMASLALDALPELVVAFRRQP